MRFKIPCKNDPDSEIGRSVFGPAAIRCLLVRFRQNRPMETDHALFWSIQKNGLPAGYLLGTIHSEDPRVLEFSEDFLDKLRASEVFAHGNGPGYQSLERLSWHTCTTRRDRTWNR